MNRRGFFLSAIILFFFVTLISVNYFVENHRTNPYMAIKKPIEFYGAKYEDILKKVDFSNAKVTMIATGDIMFHSPQLKGAYDKDTDSYNFDSTFKHIEKYIKNADIALGNFETVTAGSERGYRGYPTFNTPKSVVRTLNDIGFDILSTANNHSLDEGKRGIIETINNIKDHGIDNIGTYIEPNNEILVKNINEINIGFLSYTYGCNGLESRLTEDELSYMVNIIDEDKIKNDIIKADSLGVDMTTVFIHWGNEYQREPSQVQKDLAIKMIEWGADIILGSHPHVIQKSEMIEHEGENKFVVYSMGNFISNQRRETLTNSNRNFTEDGVMVEVQLEKDFGEGKTVIKEVNFIPTWVNRYSEVGLYKYEILPAEEYTKENRDNLSKEVLNRMEESYNNTIGIILQQ